MALRKPQEALGRKLTDQDRCDEGFDSARADEDHASTLAACQPGMRSRMLAWTHAWLMEMGNAVA
jgi:hypothetical protein